MKDKFNQRYRKSNRLKGYDYTAAGYYFVTICVDKWQCMFGDIIDGKMQLNHYGLIVEQEWLNTEKIRDNVELDEFVVMPNHFHGVIIITRSGMARHATTGARYHAQTMDERQFGKPMARSLSTIIGSFKSAVTRAVNLLGDTPGDTLWQRSFYDRIIRNEKELFNIRQYIINNPLKWEMDREKPLNLEF